MREFLTAKPCEWCRQRTMNLVTAIPFSGRGGFHELRMHLCARCRPMLPVVMRSFAPMVDEQLHAAYEAGMRR